MGDQSPEPPWARRATTSTAGAVPVRGGHKFKIVGYSLAKGVGPGRYVASETFEVAGRRWALRFYPDGAGDNPGDNGRFVSLYVERVKHEEEGDCVMGQFELVLVDQSGNGNHRVERSELCAIKRRWGSKHFLEKISLEGSPYFKDDSLLVYCSMSIVTLFTKEPTVSALYVPPSNVAEHFGKLLETGEYTDISFEVDGEIFVAHKLILVARSPVFEEQFGSIKDQDTQCIKVKDMEAYIFKALLHYIYRDSLPDIVELVAWGAKSASSFAWKLLAAADRYELERLKLLCAVMLYEDVSISTVVYTLSLANQHHCSQLRAACLSFVTVPENLRAVMDTDEFKLLKIRSPKLYMEVLEHMATMNTALVNQASQWKRMPLEAVQSKQQRFHFWVLRMLDFTWQTLAHFDGLCFAVYIYLFGL